MNAKSWTPQCLHWSTCPGTRDGGGFPLLPTTWGGLAADHGVYRSMVGSDVFFQGGAAPLWKQWPKPPMGTQETSAPLARVSLPLGPVQD